MRPAIEPGDWLLVDPTVARWPRRGIVVVFREPVTDVLAIKRVAARPGDWVPFADGWLQLGDDEAWLLGDATDEALEAAGFGAAIDSRRYGPVPVDALVGRAWFRYGPARRIGVSGRRPGTCWCADAAAEPPRRGADPGPTRDDPRADPWVRSRARIRGEGLEHAGAADPRLALARRCARRTIPAAAAGPRSRLAGIPTLRLDPWSSQGSGCPPIRDSRWTRNRTTGPATP